MSSPEDLCPDCEGSGQKGVVCGWCLEGVPHSSCDDTFQAYCHCEKGQERRKWGGPAWGGEWPPWYLSEEGGD